MSGTGVLVTEAGEEGGNGFVAADGDGFGRVGTDLDMDLMWGVHVGIQLVLREGFQLDTSRDHLLTHIRSTFVVFWENFPRFLRFRSRKRRNTPPSYRIKP
jgi:hypothetical protein